MSDACKLFDKHRRVLYTGSTPEFARTLSEAVEADVRLDGFAPAEAQTVRGLSFAGARLSESDFLLQDCSNCDFSGAAIARACFDHACLMGADLRDTGCLGASFSYARLKGARINWQSPELVSELLFQAAGSDLKKVKIASLVASARRLGWCWYEYLKLRHPGTAWALSALAPYVTEDDDAPEPLFDAAEKLREKQAASA